MSIVCNLPAARRVGAAAIEGDDLQGRFRAHAPYDVLHLVLGHSEDHRDRIDLGHGRQGIAVADLDVIARIHLAQS
ncbi:MAG: hypothetical protein ACHQIO_14210, partial [Nevskiales bacterium]